MSSFFKSRSVCGTSSVGSSSTSLLISKENKPQPTSSGKDYPAALGSLASQYGASDQAPSLPASSPQPQSQPQKAQKVRAKEFGAKENKYGAIGNGSMTSTI